MNPANESNNGYIYVRRHPSYEKCPSTGKIYNACKLGKTKNIVERDATYRTGEIKKGNYEDVYAVPIKSMDKIERLLQFEFKEFHIKEDAGTEFYDNKIIELIEIYLINKGFVYRKLTKQEISDQIRINRVRQTFNKINIKSLIQALKVERTVKRYTWYVRDYQINIKNHCLKTIQEEFKIYLELPTGGGKSYIVYNLFYGLKSDFIIIVSPRKIVNSQNISDKYLQILKDKYVTFNCSNDSGLDQFLQLSSKKILICCTQSINKIYEKILDNNITNITIWFDEAHWGVEEWISDLKTGTNAQFWLQDNRYIKYRIFTSASPNKVKVLENENIFGKLYSPIKVKDLIELKWLAKIIPLVYSENKINIDNVKHVIDDFNKKNRNFGFSFHNKQRNAFNLFYSHYLEYKCGNTHIKPFLLVNNNFTDEKEPRLKNINLNYDYKNIQTYQNSIYSIGYVVAKYSMGYDFNKLDYICLSDPKLSIADIIQCIGRGIRPDELGLNGLNREKVLIISLPVYIDENGDNKYEKAIEVLKYLIHDIDIQYEDFVFINRYSPSSTNGEHKTAEYIGINNVESVLLDLLELENKRIITYEKATQMIVDKGVKTKEEYYELCDREKKLPRDPKELFKGKFTNWIHYLNIGRTFYYDLETCKDKIQEYLVFNPSIKKSHLDLYLSTTINELCKLDARFPPNDLWIEYYGVKDLRDIIVISSNKKKNSNIVL
jgi:hypothetical protein